MQQPSFTQLNGRHITLGMFCVDVFRFLDNEGNDTGQRKAQELGGAGTYLIDAIGARTFLESGFLGQIIHLSGQAGNSTEKEEKIRADLEQYGSDMWDIQPRQDGEGTTIGENTFKGQARDFKFLSPPIRIWPSTIAKSRFFPPYADLPGSVHFPSAPERTEGILKELDEIDNRLRTAGGSGWKPYLLWEPFPKNCTAQEYEEHASLLDRMTIVSPNHVEALSLAGHIPSPFTSDSELLRLFPNENDYWAILQRTGKLLLKGMKINSHQDGWERGVIIRVGALGCLVLTSSSITRIPAYFGEDDQDKVKDVTGGGNAFLGGVVAGMQLTDGRSLVEAALYGTVAASFAIEQPGLPTLSRNQQGEELWNGSLAEERFNKLKRRVAVHAANIL